MKPPSISVIMPAKNASGFIADALRSIVLQDHPLEEVLIIDDHCDDDTMDIVASFKAALPQIRVLKGPGRGPGPARNIALEEAKGEVIAFLDADDLWPEGKLECQMARIIREPRADVVAGRVRWFETQSSVGLVPDAKSRMLDSLCVNLGASLYRKEVFERIGRFDEDYVYSEDLDFFMRLRESDIPFVILPRPTLFYRRHPQSMTFKYSDRERRDFGRAITMSIVRRRRQGRTSDLPPMESYVEAAAPGTRPGTPP